MSTSVSAQATYYVTGDLIEVVVWVLDSVTQADLSGSVSSIVLTLKVFKAVLATLSLDKTYRSLPLRLDSPTRKAEPAQTGPSKFHCFFLHPPRYKDVVIGVALTLDDATESAIDLPVTIEDAEVVVKGNAQ